MKHIGLKKGVLALSLAVSCLNAQSLDEVLNDVLKTNPDVLEKQKAYNGAIYDKKIARSGYFPSLIFQGEGGWKLKNNNATSYENEDDLYYQARLIAQQNVFDWGKTSADNEAKKAHAFFNLYGYLRVSNDIAYKTIKAYIDVLKFHELKKLSIQNVKTHEKILRSVKMRLDAGKQGRSELERVLGRLSSAKTKMLLRQSEYERALHIMHKYVGRFIDYDAMSKPDINEALLPLTLKQAFSAQISSHPTFLQGLYAIKQKEFEHKRQKRSTYGKLYLEASAKLYKQRHERKEREFYGALKYDYTIFNGLKDKATTQKAKSSVFLEQQKQLSVRRALTNDLQLTWSAYKLVYSQIGEMKKSLYFTKKALQTYKQEFKLGKRMLIAILDAQNEYQNTKEQLETLKYNLLSEKFRVLYSQGTLLKDLKLLSPKVIELMNESKKLKVLSKDKLPLDYDFDKDGVKNKKDISVNNTPNTQIDELGINLKMLKTNKIEDSLIKKIQEKIIIIKDKKDLVKNPIKTNVLVRFDFVSFKPHSIELSESSKDTMRYLIEQIKKYSSEGMLYIKIGTHEYKDEFKNRDLALKRAYNFKRILQAHNIDKDSIQVFADTKTKTPKSYLALKVINSNQDYQNQYESAFFKKPTCKKADTKLTKDGKEQIKKLSKLIKQKNISFVDVIVYSNDFKDLIKNKKLSIKRVKSIKNEFAKNGIGKDKLMVFSWGAFKDEGFLSSNIKNYNKIEYILRDK